MGDIIEALAIKYGTSIDVESVNFSLPANSNVVVLAIVPAGWTAYITHIGGYSSQDDVQVYLKDHHNIKRMVFGEWPDTFAWWDLPRRDYLGPFSKTAPISGTEATFGIFFESASSVAADINLCYQGYLIKNQNVEAFEKGLLELANIPSNIKLIADRLKFLENFIKTLK